MENYADNSSAYVTGRVLGSLPGRPRGQRPVGSFKANQHRLYDMGGNVAEWVHDVQHSSANGATEVDPLGAQNGDNYVIRGASWSTAKLLNCVCPTGIMGKRVAMT